jgi:hypothetical protein
VARDTFVLPGGKPIQAVTNDESHHVPAMALGTTPRSGTLTPLPVLGQLPASQEEMRKAGTQEGRNKKISEDDLCVSWLPAFLDFTSCAAEIDGQEKRGQKNEGGSTTKDPAQPAAATKTEPRIEHR